jgi:hypothetical protein
MSNIRLLSIFIVFLFLSGCKNQKQNLVVLSAPAGSLYTSINKDGELLFQTAGYLPPQEKVWLLLHIRSDLL